MHLSVSVSIEGQRMAYHDGESLGTDVEGQNFEGVSDEHRSIGDVVEEVEDEDERDGCCTKVNQIGSRSVQSNSVSAVSERRTYL